jgi:DNA polymerase-1
VSGLVTLDLETGSAADLYRTGPGYVRLTGSARDDGPVEVAHELPAVEAKAAITGAATITGHNIIGFDLPALVGENVLSMAEVHEMAAGRRLFDGLLVSRYLDPPMAREHGVDARRRHDLGSLAQRYGLSEKLSDVSGALAKKYGGWGGIPVDPMDPDADRRADAVAFREYLVRDVELSRALYQELARDLIKIGAPAYHYVAREHRVAALATQFSVNGFRVDVPELDRRVADVATRKRDSLAWLHEKHGIPLADAKGKAYASPLGTKGGKAALTAALVGLGVSESALWKTDRTGELQVSGDHMLHLGRDYGQGNPALSELLKAVYRVVSARTVYDTVHSHLIGDRVHPRISMAQTTGRWSVTDPGLTVMGKHGGRHVERAVFLPDPGEALVAFDLSQVDMRAIAGLSGDQAYIEMLSTEDPHSAIALALFGTVDRRQDAKAIGHGWNYGRGIRAISDGAGIDPALVRQFEQSMHQRFPRLIEWREEVRAVAASGTLLDNGFGRRMRPDPERAYTQGPALMGQGAARDLMMEGLLRLPAEVLPMLRAQIHDEIILSVPFGEVEAVSEAVIKALSFEWKGVPILADRSPAGSTWAACYEK